MSDPPRPADAEPGFDESDPYAGDDVSSLPRWWRENVEQFRAHEMRPYRPPRFVDGERATTYVRELEEKLDVEIRFRVVDPQEGNEWKLLVDGDPIRSVDRWRDGEGYSVYGIESSTFERVVLESADD